VCAGSNPPGGTAHRPNSNTLTILNRLGARPVTCENADAFRTLPPVRPRKQDPSRGKPSSAAKRNDGHQAVACPQAVALPPISAATQRQPEQRGNIRGAAAAQPARSPLRPFGQRLTTPSQAVRILTRLIRSGADAGDPSCYRRIAGMLDRALRPCRSGRSSPYGRTPPGRFGSPARGPPTVAYQGQ
jgi:hypothetical protein